MKQQAESNQSRDWDIQQTPVFLRCPSISIGDIYYRLPSGLNRRQRWRSGTGSFSGVCQEFFRVLYMGQAYFQAHRIKVPRRLHSARPSGQATPNDTGGPPEQLVILQISWVPITLQELKGPSAGIPLLSKFPCNFNY